MKEDKMGRLFRNGLKRETETIGVSDFLKTRHGDHGKTGGKNDEKENTF